MEGIDGGAIEGGGARVGRSVGGGRGSGVLAVEVGLRSTLTGQVTPKLVSRSAPIRSPSATRWNKPFDALTNAQMHPCMHNCCTPEGLMPKEFVIAKP